MIIKEQVNKELDLQRLISAMIHYLTAIKSQSYLPADERIKALEEVRKAIPTALRCLFYLKTKEINK